MSNLRTISRSHTVVFSFFLSCRQRARARVSFRNPNHKPRFSSPPSSSPWFESLVSNGTEPWFRLSQRRTLVRASNWTDQRSPYETLDAWPSFIIQMVYDGRGTLEEGETAEARSIKIQAAYELLIDDEKWRKYDMDNRVDPMKASQAWMEWLMRKRRAFDQRGDMAIQAWAEQQQRELSLRVRHLSDSKVDPEEERRILAKEKKASEEYLSNTLRRHTLVLKRRDLMRKKAEEEKKKAIISRILAAEGLELDIDDEAP